MMVRSPELDLDLLSRQLLKDDASLTLNEVPQRYLDHKQYCRLLGIEGGAFDILVSQYLLDLGRAELYRKRPLTERILSTSSIETPEIPVVEVADDGSTDEEAAL